MHRSHGHNEMQTMFVLFIICALMFTPYYILATSDSSSAFNRMSGGSAIEIFNGGRDTGNQSGNHAPVEKMDEAIK